MIWFNFNLSWLNYINLLSILIWIIRKFRSWLLLFYNFKSGDFFYPFFFLFIYFFDSFRYLKFDIVPFVKSRQVFSCVGLIAKLFVYFIHSFLNSKIFPAPIHLKYILNPITFINSRNDWVLHLIRILSIYTPFVWIWLVDSLNLRRCSILR